MSASENNLKRQSFVEQEVVVQREWTDLHTACADSRSTLEDLRAVLKDDPAAAKIKDSKGRFPLSIIAQNEDLHLRCQNELDLFILNVLLPCNRQALTTPDDRGYLPFIEVITNWIYQIHGKGQHQDSAMTSYLEKPSNDQSSSPWSSSNSPDDPETPSATTAPTDEEMEKYIPSTTVPLDLMVAWSIDMLSAILEREKRSAFKIIDAVAKTPCFLKCLLLVEDDKARILLGTDLVLQVMLCEDSFGPWLVHMLKSKDAMVQKRAVTYLEMISDIQETGKLLMGRADAATLTRASARGLFSRERSYTEKTQHMIFVKATSLPSIIPAMLHLKKSEFERGSTTGLIQFILDEQLFQPKTLFVIVLDMLFLVLILLFFILSSYDFFYYQDLALNKGRFVQQQGTPIVMISAAYFIFRHLCAFFKLPTNLLIATSGIWSIIDILSICMAVAMQFVFLRKLNTHDDYGIRLSNIVLLRALSAVTTGLLFMKVLGYFKILNKYLATFVFALGVIAGDVFWFIWILILLIATFAQMFYTVLSGEGQCTMADDGPFCSAKSSYIYTYTILLGEFELQDFTTWFSKLLFVVYSFCVVIIVTNFLIAIISDSYDKSMTRIAKHFGRARIMFMVEVTAFLTYFEPSSEQIHRGRCFRCWNSRVRRFLWPGNGFCCLFKFSISFSFASTIIAMFFTAIGWFSIPAAANIVVLYLSAILLSALLSRCFDMCFDSRPMRCVRCWIGRHMRCVWCWIGKFLLFFFGLILGKSRDGTSSFRNRSEDHAWAGRLNYLKIEMKQAVLESEALVHVSLAAEKKTTERLEGQVVSLNLQMRDMKKMLSNIESKLEMRDMKKMLSNIESLLGHKIEAGHLSSGIVNGEGLDENVRSSSPGILPLSTVGTAELNPKAPC